MLKLYRVLRRNLICCFYRLETLMNLERILMIHICENEKRNIRISDILGLREKTF